MKFQTLLALEKRFLSKPYKDASFARSDDIGRRERTKGHIENVK